MNRPSIEIFGTDPNGEPVHIVRLQNGGSQAAIMSWGASLQDYTVRDWEVSVVLGSPDFKTYLGPLVHCGAVVGRVANRIAHGRASLNGQMLELDRNEKGKTCLHGGGGGTSLRNWTIVEAHKTQTVLAISLADGEDGFPGKLEILATYSLDDVGALCLNLRATSDALTFCNLAHHGYWSFAPEDGLQGHHLSLSADSYLPVDDDLIPLGAPADVEGTRFDFRTRRALKRHGDALLDHNFCLQEAEGMRRVGRMDYGPMRLDVETDALGLQVYEGAHLNTAQAATHSGVAYGSNAGLAIEPQAWPDAPNHPGYPDTRLKPGETYRQVSRFHAYARS